VSLDRDRLRDFVQASLWCALGALTAFIASSPMNLVLYGSVLPTHLTEEAVKSTQTSPYLTVRMDVITSLFVSAEYPIVYGVALIAGAAASLYAGLRRTASRAPLVIVHVSIAVTLGLGVAIPLWHLARGIPQFNAYNVASAAHTWVFALPLLYAPWFSTVGRRPLVRYLIVSGLTTLLLTSLVVPSNGGAQWSPRYFLLVTPLLAVPAVELGRSLTAPRLSAWMSRVALAASSLMLVLGIGYLTGAKELFASVTHELARVTTDGEPIITDVFWVPEVAATLAPSRRMLFSWNLSDAPQMAALAVHAGIERFSVVTYALLTARTAPDSIEVPGAKCLYVRGEHQFTLRVPGVVLSRYSCASQ
jgi:hypothetical protein